MDKYIINKAQEVYDYLWDQFGLTKGMLCSFLFCFQTFLVLRQDNFIMDVHDVITLFITAGLVIMAGFWHNLQVKGDYHLINRLAAIYREGLPLKAFRYYFLLKFCVFLFLVLVFILAPILNPQTNLKELNTSMLVMGFINNVSVLAVNYFVGVGVRDRQQKFYSKEVFDS